MRVRHATSIASYRLTRLAKTVGATLSAHRGPVSAEAFAKSFTRARVDRIDELLDALASLGQAREVADGLYVPPTITR